MSWIKVHGVKIQLNSIGEATSVDIHIGTSQSGSHEANVNDLPQWVVDILQEWLNKRDLK